jgi:hypothetical protein
VIGDTTSRLVALDADEEQPARAIDSSTDVRTAGA